MPDIEFTKHLSQPSVEFERTASGSIKVVVKCYGDDLEEVRLKAQREFQAATKWADETYTLRGGQR